MSNIGSPRNLDFIDGYLFRAMVSILEADGADAGLYGFYEGRIRTTSCALSPYDRMLFDFVQKHFDAKEHRVVHAGIGVGTLTSTLAVAGYGIAGIEQDTQRFQVATRIREALVQAWPDVVERYELFFGGFPAIVEKTPWTSSNNVLIFTNCGAGWSEELTTEIITSMRLFGATILDARLFGRVRESSSERDELIHRIESLGLSAMPIQESTPSTFYYRVQPR